jgi:hypothetical protein
MWLWIEDLEERKTIKGRVAAGKIQKRRKI